MINNVDNNYAYVLFALGMNKNKLQSYYEWTSQLLTILESNENFCRLLANASIEKKERKSMIDEIFGHELDETFIYFLWVVIDFNRVRDLINIFKLFLKLCQQHFGINYVQVSSAYSLTDEQITALKKALEDGMGLARVTINNLVDPKLIGGIKLKTHAISIDDTIRNKLDKMRETSFKLAQQGE
ncbi:MAG: ATP synthase F1 subunit delta [Mycoplasmataceae bacterium]|nr:ATP synthase F1 subunit delta [Mycoplasmataceae bacterium]